MDTVPTQTAGPVPLGRLLSDTFAYCRAHWQTLAIGVVIFGVIMGLIAATVASKMEDTIVTGMDNMGLDTDRMQELALRMEDGDESAMRELETMLQGEFGGMDEDDIAAKMMGPAAQAMMTAVPLIGFSMLVSWLLSLLSYAYYSLVAVEGKDVAGTFGRAKTAMFSLFGVNFWVMLRTFIWIPIIGIIPAIILGPRFVAAPLIHLAEAKGITASASESYARTRGYWGKIVGNVIVAALVAIVISIVVNMVLAIALSSTSMGMMIAKQLVSQAMMAFMTVFTVRLSHTILQYPKA